MGWGNANRAEAHTPEERTLVKMLQAVKVRAVIDWVLDEDKLPVHQAIWNATGRRAALGQELGVTVQPPCTRCADTEKKLAWSSCRIALLDTGYFISRGSCMSCLWATEAHRCSFRTDRSEAQRVVRTCKNRSVVPFLRATTGTSHFDPTGVVGNPFSFTSKRR